MGSTTTRHALATPWPAFSPGRFPFCDVFLRSGLKRAPVSAVVLVLGVGLLSGALRFAHLTQRGLFFWDEAKFALEGIRMEQAVRLALGLHAAASAGKPVGSAKPGHALLIAAGYAVAGVHDYTPLIVDAACSVAACLVLLALGWRLRGRDVGVVAGLLLAVSEYDVLYARSGLSESDATLLFLVGIAVWLWSYRETSHPAVGSRLLMSAIILGAAFSVNYRLIVYIGTVLVLDLGWSLHQLGTKTALRRAVLWSGGLLAVPFLWQIVGVVALYRGTPLFLNEITARPASYAAEVIYQLHQGKQSVLRFAPLIYGAWYVNRNGIAASVLLLTGFVWAVARPSPVRSAVALLSLGPYAAYAFAPFVVPRNLVTALPFAALVAADGLITTARWKPPFRGPPVAVIPVALALAAIGASMTWRLTEERSGFASAAAWVRERGGRALTTSEVMAFYLRKPGGGCWAPPVPVQAGVLAADIRSGYRMAVLERHHNSPITALIAREGTLIGSWPVYGGPNLGESPVASENGTWPNAREKPEIVYLFDIGSMRIAGHHRLRPQLCMLRVPT